MDAVKTATALYQAVGKVNEVVSGKEVGQLKVDEETHWAVYYIIRPTFFISLIVTVVLIIIAKWVILLASVPLLALSAFAWYWMKDLALLKGLDVCINQLVVVVTHIEELTRAQKKNLEEEKKITEELRQINKNLEEEVKKFGLSTKKFEKTEEKINEKMAEENERLKERLKELSEIADKLKISEEQLDKEKKINSDIQEQASKMEMENNRLSENLETMKKENEEQKKNNEILSVNATKIDLEEDKIAVETTEIGENVKMLSDVNLEFVDKVEKGTEGLEAWKKLGERSKISIDRLDEHDGKFEAAVNLIEKETENIQRVEDKLDQVIKEETEETDKLNDKLEEIINMMKNTDVNSKENKF